MLDIAINHAEELKQKFRSTWFSDRYKFWANGNYYEDWNPTESTWVNHQFASLRDNEVIGYIGYSIDRAGEFVYGLNIINFEEKPSATFSVDLGRALHDIFDKYHFRKLCFTVVVGNPIEKTYDKLCQKYGGRIVGIQKSHVKLIDGNFYDEKMYEIFGEDYNARKYKGCD